MARRKGRGRTKAAVVRTPFTPVFGARSAGRHGRRRGGKGRR